MDGILAIDTGGTKCEGLLMQIDGQALSFAKISAEREIATRSGKYGYGRSSDAGYKTFSRLLKSIRTTFPRLHLCGNGTLSTMSLRDKLPAEEVLLWAAREETAALAFIGATEGFVALSGTGAFLHYRGKDQDLHYDAAGPLLGDRGSGFQIGRDTLRAAVRSMEHPRHVSPLTERVMAEMNGKNGNRKSIYDHVIHEGLRIMSNRTEVASYSRIADQAASGGDPLAIGILHRAADDLAATYADLVDHTGLQQCDLPMVATGSVLTQSEIYWQRFCEQVKHVTPNVRTVRLDQPPVAGVALAGLCCIYRCKPSDPRITQARKRLLESLPERIRQDQEYIPS